MMHKHNATIKPAKDTIMICKYRQTLKKMTATTKIERTKDHKQNEIQQHSYMYAINYDAR